MPMPPAPAPGQPQQAPFGVSPATGPTPNKGYEAAGLQKLGIVVKLLMDIAQTAGVGSDVGKAALEATTKLAKFVPSGSVNPAGEKRGIEQMAMKNAQGNAQMQALKQGGGPGGVPGGAPAPGGALPQGMPAAA